MNRVVEAVGLQTKMKTANEKIALVIGVVEDGQFTWPAPFWQQPLWRWDAMVTVGVRGALVSSQHAAWEFIGRTVAALSADPDVLRRTGKVVVGAALAREYGFTDVDGKQPRPLSLSEV